MKFGWEKKYPFVEDLFICCCQKRFYQAMGSSLVIFEIIFHQIFICNSEFYQNFSSGNFSIYFTSSYLVLGKNKTSGFVCLILSLNLQVQDLYKHLKPNQPNQSLTNFYTTSPKSFYSGVLEFCFCQIPKFLKPYVWPK